MFYNKCRMYVARTETKRGRQSNQLNGLQFNLKWLQLYTTASADSAKTQQKRYPITFLKKRGK